MLGAICIALLLFVSLRKKKSVPIYTLVALLNVLFVPSALIFAFNYYVGGLVAAHRGEEAVPASEQTAERVKALIRANCNVTYKLNLKSQA